MDDVDKIPANLLNFRHSLPTLNYLKKQKKVRYPEWMRHSFAGVVLMYPDLYMFASKNIMANLYLMNI